MPANKPAVCDPLATAMIDNYTVSDLNRAHLVTSHPAADLAPATRVVIALGLRHCTRPQSRAEHRARRHPVGVTAATLNTDTQTAWLVHQHHASVVLLGVLATPTATASELLLKIARV